MKKILLTTLAVFSLSVQADLLAVDHTHNLNKSVNMGYDAVLKSTKAEVKKAKKVGMLWKTIGGKKGLLAKAKKLHKKGNDKKAIKLLETAKVHAILGQRQAIDQANAGPNF
ncbi:MAG: hypothetical protein DSY43_07250 [Gammaproteobacteria bacterium]|uniref:Uncharacterized protein n=1 Tax=endosymbiont of Bathymodiolus septemdierum str. Myojin knoll TaxID=1303921 RepID=A0A0P0URJ6_9GAMM|nr:hypothetical protein [Bathymodiolus septemdierum thioautotrophic gill symbiont]RUA03987.1 MAG: hypothetical protein DSY43_07250 [Gammaproteobacteria bacterium]BAS67457.1 conserved hypothetical protein [endosymbiont of Bathymodiolus septemdierum str. Myojin knoll]